MLNHHRIKAVAAVIGALTIAGPVAAANAAPAPSPAQGAYQAGITAAQGGFAAGAAAAQSGWQAGANALQGSLGTNALGFPGFVNLGPTGSMGPLGPHGPGGGSGQLPTGWDAWNLGPTGPLGPGACSAPVTPADARDEALPDGRMGAAVRRDSRPVPRPDTPRTRTDGHDCTAHREIDTEATRRQFLFAREQLAAHVPGGRARVPQPLRVRSGGARVVRASRSARDV